MADNSKLFMIYLRYVARLFDDNLHIEHSKFRMECHFSNCLTVSRNVLLIAHKTSVLTTHYDSLICVAMSSVNVLFVVIHYSFKRLDDNDDGK